MINISFYLAVILKRVIFVHHSFLKIRKSIKWIDFPF